MNTPDGVTPVGDQAAEVAAPSLRDGGQARRSLPPFAGLAERGLARSAMG